jgi:DNA-binding PadR family transcriptional regulator
MQNLTARERAILVAVGDREFCGLEIVDVVKALTDGVIKLGFGSVYILLHKLEEKRLFNRTLGYRTF